MKHPNARPDADPEALAPGDRDVLRAYRELERPEPPVELGDRILARARSRHAPTPATAWRLAAGFAVLAAAAALVFNANAPHGMDENAGEATAATDPPTATGTTPKPAPAARGQRAAASAKTGADMGTTRTPDSPDDWLARLEAMQRAGDDKAFRLELKQFGEKYPEHLETARQRLGILEGE